MEAYWASIDEERPSGDDPKRVALALQRFYRDLAVNIRQAERNRWKTPLFKKLLPKVKEQIEKLSELAGEFASSPPNQNDPRLAELRRLDESVRQATFQLQTEEQNFGLPIHPSPKLNQLNYLYQGWKRGLLREESPKEFVVVYRKSLRKTQAEISKAAGKLSGRESETEVSAITTTQELLESMIEEVTNFKNSIAKGPAGGERHVEKLLELGTHLGEAFATLENCSPIKEPCPFCGGQISLSGRCKSCTRRLPHLEVEDAEVESEGPQSDFRSTSCRALDLAVLAWENSPEDPTLWKELQKAVRDFAGHVTQGRKSFEHLATAQDRPIDADSKLRQQEVALKKVGDIFQSTLSRWSRFTKDSSPPGPAPQDWRGELLEAESILKELQEALEPEESDSPSP